MVSNAAEKWKQASFERLNALPKTEVKTESIKYSVDCRSVKAKNNDRTSTSGGLPAELEAVRDGKANFNGKTTPVFEHLTAKWKRSRLCRLLSTQSMDEIDENDESSNYNSNSNNRINSSNSKNDRSSTNSRSNFRQRTLSRNNSSSDYSSVFATSDSSSDTGGNGSVSNQEDGLGLTGEIKAVRNGKENFNGHKKPVFTKLAMKWKNSTLQRLLSRDDSVFEEENEVTESDVFR